ncbi:HAMP domain-containing histidine kinase [Streptomyces sp. NRRL WC-3742]|uniref:HAMP domain-containing histidine kinase n=1 Tax=Streptomyces sp. NRRL WC-3742 TaxID=1463934 RepID=UPI0004C614DE|nr:HAMP domain-containing histidine kinase [Streptomyces sp. NRRL WC-3742]
MTAPSPRRILLAARRIACLAVAGHDGRPRGRAPAARNPALALPPGECGTVARSLRWAVTGAPKGSVELSLPARLPPVTVTPEQLRPVVAAMVESALLRTPPGGRVLVRAEAVQGRHGDPGEIQVRVADRGLSLTGEAKYGMFPGQHDTIPGQRWTPPEGGRLTVEDNPGGGLVFVLVLPVAAHR